MTQDPSSSAPITLSSNPKEWQPLNIPAALRNINQWRQCYPLNTQLGNTTITTAKRPIGGPKLTPKAPGAQFKEIITTDPALFWGFCFTPADSIVGIDVDNLKEGFTHNDLPNSIQELLLEHPTYSEISPSGKGLHIIYKTDKQQLLHRAAADQATVDFDGAVYIRDQFLTFTGHTFTTNSLAEIEPSILEQRLLKPTNIVSFPNAPRPQSIEPQLTWQLLVLTLNRIPPSLSTHPARERFYEIYRTFTPPLEQPSDYEHWRIVAAALHHGAATIGMSEQGAEVFDEWSATDTQNYESSAAAQKKYRDNPPRFDGSDISYQTLFKLAKAAQPRWPYPRLNKKGAPTEAPDINNIENWITLLAHLDLRFESNEMTSEIRVSGNEICQEQFFYSIQNKTSLDNAVMRFAHNTYFQGLSPSMVSKYAEHIALQAEYNKYSPVKEWIDAAPAPTPDAPSEFDRLFDTLKTPPHEDHLRPLYRTYVKKSLMGVIRAHYYKGSAAASTGIVILQGPEQTNKSTWVRHLLPPSLRQYILCSQQSLNNNTHIKEIQMELPQAQIWLRDEVEALFKKSDEAIKNLLVQESDVYRPLYSNTVANVKRRTIFWGTTNVPELPITDNGNRRIQIIPVVYCDTYVPIDMQRVYKELLTEFEATPPAKQHELWILTKEEIEQTNLVNTSLRQADQDLDIYLKTTFDYEAPFEWADWKKINGEFNKTKGTAIGTIIAAIQAQCGITVRPVTLKHALRRCSGAWTQTLKPKQLKSCLIKNGEAIYSKANGAKSAGYWIVPPKKPDF